MDGYGEDDDRSAYDTPYQDPTNPDNPPSWTFIDDAHPTASPSHRPEHARRSRHSSLPQALFGSGSTSIFGSGAPSAMQQQQEDEQEDEQEHEPEAESTDRYGNVIEQPGPERPSVAVSPPSQENVATSPVPSRANIHTHLVSPYPKTPTRLTRSPHKTTEGWYQDEGPAVLDRRRIPQVEKDADDPTTPPSSSRLGVNRQESTTLTTLSRLFAVQAAVSPATSRSPSYIQPTKAVSYTRALHSAETAALPDHLFTRGLLEGRHSDITVNAFGHQYRLHRLILDRAPFFHSALSEPWLEANAKETTVHPEDIDSNISQSSFELALKRLYGCSSLLEEDQDAVGLFATGCWLEMQDLIDSSIESMLRQMMPETLSSLIKLVTSNYYGRAGDKILASAKAMLCRDGWRMQLRYWDGIPGDIIREIVGGDGFFVDGEWDRWVLAKRILDRRLKLRAIEIGLTDSGNRRKILKAPEVVNLMAVRFDGVYRKNSIGTGRGVPDSLHRWIGLYTHPDVEPLLVLLDEGIHYIHLDFEQLQYIRGARDVLGLPIMPEKVISNALWQQMELRQKVMNAREPEMELDLSVRYTEDTPVPDAGRDTTMSITTPSSPPPSKGKQKITEDVTAFEQETGEDLDSGSWDGNGKPRKFWIPSSDCNIVMGGSADPIIATSNNTMLQRHASRLSATIQPEDVQWASDFAAATSQPRPPTASGGEEGAGEVRYTHFPPFRFAAEFPNPRLLKEKKRVYSRTVFYAGSLWNIYIQKVASTRSKQLGVYLHRAKERETEEVVAGTAGMAQGSVDERIGQLEREMILRSERHERRLERRRRTLEEGDVSLESEGSAVDQGSLEPSEGSQSARAETMRHLSRLGQAQRFQTDPVMGSSPSSANDESFHLTPDSDSEGSSGDENNTAEETSRLKRSHVPTLPPYVDARPTIKTYFKIYSPSRGGRMLSVYESAPDKFNFSQSWGWKSSTLMLDEGILGDEMDEPKEEGASGVEGEKIAGRPMKGKGDGKLRFMVVIGNI